MRSTPETRKKRLVAARERSVRAWRALENAREEFETIRELMLANRDNMTIDGYDTSDTDFGDLGA